MKTITGFIPVRIRSTQKWTRGGPRTRRIQKLTRSEEFRSFFSLHILDATTITRRTATRRRRRGGARQAKGGWGGVRKTAKFSDLAAAPKPGGGRGRRARKVPAGGGGLGCGVAVAAQRAAVHGAGVPGRGEGGVEVELPFDLRGGGEPKVPICKRLDADEEAQGLLEAVRGQTRSRKGEEKTRRNTSP